MNTPRPEYPRPRLVRDKWINLNGEWQFTIDHGNSGYERKFYQEANSDVFDKTIIVPFVPESKLSGIEYIDFMKAVWYKKVITLPEGWCPKGGRILLNFGAVDYETTIWINEKKAGYHRGGYTPFTVDISDFVVKGENTITLYAYDDVKDNLQPTGKQVNYSYFNAGCHYTRCTGIWQTVWMEYVPSVYVKKLKLTPDVDNAKLDIRVTLNAYTNGETVTAKASFDGKVVSEITAGVTGEYADFALPMADAKLWSLDEPNLYDLEISVKDDVVTSYFGMRKVAINGYAVEINGKPVYQRLVLDQGYYPDGIYTAPTDEDLKKDVELSKAVGFNGARLHMKVFEPRLSYWADKLGYLLWGEYPNWGLDEGNKAALLAMLPEWIEAVERDYNSPAIVGWCPFNETGERRHADLFEVVYDVTRAIDPMRPIIDTSGYVHSSKTDIYDVHDYDQNPASFKERYMSLITGEGEVHRNNKRMEKYGGQPYFVSEFGGTHWDIDKEPGDAGWGYGEAPKTIDEFYTRFEGLINVLLDNPKMCAFCYTQLTDVYQEKNGIYAFDRRTKFDTEKLHKIMTKKAAIEE
jgi:Beta-galactosidase/beta-glucuronidase